jgi:polyketide biosynthesis acyl carrier protein
MTASAERMSDLVRDTVARILPGVPRGEMTGDRHLKDLGADSVDRVEIILALIERLGLDEPMSSFSALPDLDALVGFLVAKEGGGHALRH